MRYNFCINTLILMCNKKSYIYKNQIIKMKLFKTLCFAVLTLSITTIFAQGKPFDNGKIVYAMTTKVNNPQMGEMVMDATMDYYVKNEHTKMLMSMDVMGMSMKINVVANTNKKEGVMYMDAMGQKIGAKITPADYAEIEKTNEKKTVKEVKKTGKKSTILGYPCEEAVVTYDNGEVVTVTFTNQLKPVKIEGYDGAAYIEGIDGLPLKYQTKTDKADITVEATVVDPKPLTSTDFSYEIPAGYQEVSFSDLKNGGGM